MPTHEQMIQELENGHVVEIVETFSTDVFDFYKASDYAWGCTDSEEAHPGDYRSASWAYQKRLSKWNGWDGTALCDSCMEEHRPAIITLEMIREATEDLKDVLKVLSHAP